ncbi:TIR domain-containing protein [Vibrio campbellii]|uniref:TIR domain-containing protein n=2 Tax=Vibrio harveyi group TaxID=717610 RepID=UPI0038CD87CC
MFSEKITKYIEDLEEIIDYDYSILSNTIDCALKVSTSWFGSLLGYHARVYYRDFMAPPSGAHFSSEWGLYSNFEGLGLCSHGDWVEYTHDDVVNYIHRKSGSPDLSNCRQQSQIGKDVVIDVKSKVCSIIYSQKDLIDDTYLNKLLSELEEVNCPSAKDFQNSHLPKGKLQFSTKDQHVEPKIEIPPHIKVLCSAYELSAPFAAAKELKKVLIKIGDYLNNLEYKMSQEKRIGTNVFIGHGRSHDWRDLKDFINERLSLPWDEFNRVPVAGLTNITRLAQMLDQACIAFLVMSAEDEQADGNHHARMNVIHEVGLFQGRLGFERAIVLLEEGCEEFSNIQGLGQIRYPKGNISAVFEDIRQVLEREGIV